MVSFLVVKNGCILAFERKERGLGEETPDIIRLIGAQDVLQN